VQGTVQGWATLGWDDFVVVGLDFDPASTSALGEDWQSVKTVNDNHPALVILY